MKRYLKFSDIGLKLELFVCNTLLKSCPNLSAYKLGKQLPAHVLKFVFVSDVFADDFLVHMCAKCRSIEDANSVFSKIPKVGVASWSVMIGRALMTSLESVRTSPHMFGFGGALLLNGHVWSILSGGSYTKKYLPVNDFVQCLHELEKYQIIILSSMIEKILICAPHFASCTLDMEILILEPSESILFEASNLTTCVFSFLTEQQVKGCNTNLFLHGAATGNSMIPLYIKFEAAKMDLWNYLMTKLCFVLDNQFSLRRVILCQYEFPVEDQVLKNVLVVLFNDVMKMEDQFLQPVMD